MENSSNVKNNDTTVCTCLYQMWTDVHMQDRFTDVVNFSGILIFVSNSGTFHLTSFMLLYLQSLVIDLKTCETTFSSRGTLEPGLN